MIALMFEIHGAGMMVQSKLLYLFFNKNILE